MRAGVPDEIAFAPVLNLHQPEGNLEDLLEHDPWAATEILYALDRIARTLWSHEDVGRVHLSVSGTLLSTLADPAFQARAYGIVDCESLLWHWQNTGIIDVLATAHFHPVLPLVPPADRLGQLERWRAVGERLFARTTFAGFWPPELGFTMDLIPLLCRLGYRYAVVDSAHVEPPAPGIATFPRSSRPPPTATTAGGSATPRPAPTSGAPSTSPCWHGSAPATPAGSGPPSSTSTWPGTVPPARSSSGPVRGTPGGTTATGSPSGRDLRPSAGRWPGSAR